MDRRYRDLDLYACVMAGAVLIWAGVLIALDMMVR